MLPACPVIPGLWVRTRPVCKPSRVRGRLGQVLQSIVGDLAPEAAYFTEEHGQRTAVLFLEVKDPSEIPRVAEPWFLAFDADVRMRVAMKAEDLAKAGTSFKDAAQKYGK